jgi:hypothetical protein
MTGPGGIDKEVARVSVRVLPDTSEWDRLREKLERAVDKITVPVEFDVDRDQLQRELESIRADLTIPVGFDVENIRDNIERATAGQRPEVPVDLDVDENSINEQLSDISRDVDPIDLDVVPHLDAGPLRAEEARIQRLLNDLDNRRVTPHVELLQARFQAQLRELARLDAERVTIPVTPDVDIDQDRTAAVVQSRLARLQQRLRLELDAEVNLQRVERTLSGMGNVFRRTGSAISSAFGQGLSRVLDGVTASTDTLNRHMLALLSRMGRVLGVAIQIGAAATVLPIIGAAATAAWGALSTAISTIPAAIGLIGVPIAAVALGLEGIKKAASRLEPEFTKLKGTISEVFADGLTPVFERLRGIFPLLTTGLKGVAGSLVGLADDMSRFVTSAGRMAQIEVILNRVTEALKKMSPGIQDILAGFLSLASQQGAFDVLTGAINAFGAAFKKNVAETILSGDLDRAFEGLEVLLMNVAKAFAGLVKNGIIVFANAAPGLNSGFRAISNFFGRFDWARLGREVGGVFEGLGAALDRVDTATIREIEDAFGELTEMFKDPRVQEQIEEIVDGIPAAIRILGELSGLFLDIAAAASEFAQGIDDLNKKLEPFFEFMDKLGLDENGEGILTSSAKWWNDLIDLWEGMIQKVKDLWYDFTSWFNDQDITPPQTQFTPGSGTGFFDFDLPTLPDFGDIDPPGFAPGWGDLDDAIGGFIDDATDAARDAIARMLGAVEIGLVSVRQAFSFEGVGTAVGLAFLGMVGTVRLGMESLAQTVLTGMGPVNAAFNFEAVRTAVGVAFLGMVGTVTLGMQSIANAVLAGMPAINTAFNFGSIRTAMGVAFLGMVGTVNLGMQSIANAVLTGMPLVNAAFNFEPVKLNLGLAFLAMVGTVRLGMQSIAQAVIDGMPLVNAAFNFAPVHVALGLAFLAMVGTVRLGMESIAVAVEEGVARIIAAMTGGMNGILAFWASNWNAVLSVVSSAWVAIGGAVGAGIARAVSLVSAGLSQLVAVWRANWSALIAATVQGANQVVAQFMNLVARALAALRTMIAGAAAVGGAIIRALAGAISSGASTVISAASALARRVLDTWKRNLGINSPSKEFMKLGGFMIDGLVIGIESGAPRVNTAVESLADSAITTADKIAEAFSGDSWAADFNSKIEHSFGEMSAGLSNKDVVGQLRNMNGTASQSTMLMSTMIAVLQAILAQGQGGGGVALGAQASRQQSELGAF